MEEIIAYMESKEAGAAETTLADKESENKAESVKENEEPKTGKSPNADKESEKDDENKNNI